MNRGSSVADMLIFVFIIVCVILPLFSFIMEWSILENKASIIRDAMDLANISAYNAINCGDLSKNEIMVANEKVYQFYLQVLAENLKLDNELYPQQTSIVYGQVDIKSLVIYDSVLPATCERRTDILKPSIHSVISVPVKPSLFAGMLIKLSGKEHMYLELHVDTEIPKNN